MSDYSPLDDAPLRRFGLGHRLTVLLPLVIASLLYLLLYLKAIKPAIQKPRDRKNMIQCQNNLVAIGLALRQYHGVYGQLPPAYVVGPDGKPWHSWRVLILPFLGETAIYNAYRFDEPWDGPNNRKLAASMPSIYRCPSASSSAADPEASYVVFTGPDTAFPGTRCVSISVMTAPEYTVLVGEGIGARVQWMEPRDIPFDSLTVTRSGLFRSGLGPGHPPGVVQFVCADGEWQRYEIDKRDKVHITTHRYENFKQIFIIKKKNTEKGSTRKRNTEKGSGAFFRTP